MDWSALSLNGFPSSSNLVFWQSATQIGVVVVIAILGWIVARLVRRLVMRMVDVVRVSKITADTPLESYFHNQETLERVQRAFGALAFWLVLIVTFQVIVSVLGITPVAVWLERMFSVVPRILSACFILVLGVIAAGLVESVVKTAAKNVSSSWSRLVAKVASYLVMTATILVAIAELGIASNFILILFIGIVAGMALAFGLAVGLGSKEVIAELLAEWIRSSRVSSSQSMRSPK